MYKKNKEYATAKFSNVNNEWHHSCMYFYLLTNKFYGLFDKHNIRESHEFSLINMTHDTYNQQKGNVCTELHSLRMHLSMCLCVCKSSVNIGHDEQEKLTKQTKIVC